MAFTWRPVVEGIVTLKELDEYWTIEDLNECHAMLKVKDKAMAGSLGKLK